MGRVNCAGVPKQWAGYCHAIHVCGVYRWSILTQHSCPYCRNIKANHIIYCMFRSRRQYVRPKVHQLVAFWFGGAKRRLVQIMCSVNAVHIAKLSSILLHVMLVSPSIPSAVSDENHHHGHILGTDVSQTIVWFAVVFNRRSHPRRGVSTALPDQWCGGWQVQQYYGLALSSVRLLYLRICGGVFWNGSEEFERIDLDAQYSVVDHWHLCCYGTYCLDCFAVAIIFVIVGSVLAHQ